MAKMGRRGKGKKPQTARQRAASKRNIAIAQRNRDKRIVSEAERRVGKGKNPYTMGKAQRARHLLGVAAGTVTAGAAGAIGGGSTFGVVGAAVGGALGATYGAARQSIVGTITKRRANRKRLEERGARVGNKRFNVKKRNTLTLGSKQTSIAGAVANNFSIFGAGVTVLGFKGYNAIRNRKGRPKYK